MSMTGLLLWQVGPLPMDDYELDYDYGDDGAPWPWRGAGRTPADDAVVRTARKVVVIPRPRREQPTRRA
jgi:hypothetical protein